MSYTAEQVEKLAEFARDVAGLPREWLQDRLLEYGLITSPGILADWLRPEDWAMRAAREYYGNPDPNALHLPQVDPEELRRLAAIIRKHAEDRT